MNYSVEKYLEIDMDKVNPGNFVDTDRWNVISDKLKEIKNILDEMIRIIELDSSIPKSLSGMAHTYRAIFVSYLNQVSEDKKGQPSQLASEKATIFNRIEGWHRELLEKNNQKSDQMGFFETYSAIKSLDKNSVSLDYEEMKKIKEKSLDEANIISSILKEVQKKGSKESVSDYAEIFGSESEENRIISNRWLFVGIVLSFGFICLLFFADFNNKFPTQELLSDGFSVQYKIGNIITKVLIYAISIFFISFSFKQYTIRRHLSTINRHRQNGMDSFKLFIESIDKEDFETRNTLMLQLAKTIYEQSSSGYINSGRGNVNSGIIEITKMIKGNSPE